MGVDTGGPTDRVPLHIYERAEKIQKRVGKVLKVLGKIISGLGYTAAATWCGFILWNAWTAGLGWVVIVLVSIAIIGFVSYWYEITVDAVVRKAERNGVVDE